MAAAAHRHSGTRYSKLENAVDSPGHHYAERGLLAAGGAPGGSGGGASQMDAVAIQQRMLLGQDEQLDVISDSIGTLKTVSRQIGLELDEQAVYVVTGDTVLLANCNFSRISFSRAFRMLDDFGNELESTESKLDTTMKKVAKVLHMNNGKRFIQ